MRPMMLAAVTALAAIAAAVAPPADAADGGLIEALRGNGAEVTALGSRGGLQGYLVTPARGTGYSLYLTEDGHAVAGLLYGPDGVEVTGEQLARAGGGEASVDGRGAGPHDLGGAPVATAHATVENSGAEASPGRAGLFERSLAAFGFTLGERGTAVVLFADPTCRWSRSAAARLGREALAGRLQLRVVPVAVLGAVAARETLAIAAHPNPALAWFEGASGPVDPRAGDTRAGDTRAADRRGAERIARNNALFEGWGENAVPLIAWLTRDGAVAHRVGDIDDVGAWLKETLVPGTGLE